MAFNLFMIKQCEDLLSLIEGDQKQEGVGIAQSV